MALHTPSALWRPVSVDRLSTICTVTFCQAVFTCRQMDYSDCTVCGVDMLTSGSTRSPSFYPQVLLVYRERDLTGTHKHCEFTYIYINSRWEEPWCILTGKQQRNTFIHHVKLYLSGLGKYSHSHGAGMHSALFFSLGDPLNSMDSSLKLHPLVAVRAADAGRGVT